MEYIQICSTVGDLTGKEGGWKFIHEGWVGTARVLKLNVMYLKHI